MAQSPNPEWMNQWQDLSKNYLAAWQAMSQVGAGAAPAATAAAPWQQGLEQWSRLFAGSGAQGETIERIIDSAKGYAAFMQSMLAASGVGAGAGVTPAWSDLFRPAFGVPGMDAGAFDHPMLRVFRDLQGQGGNGFAQTLSAFGAMRPPSMGALGDPAEWKSWLNLPAFGLMREHQEHHQKTALAWVDYQEQMQRYNALMLKASQRGFQLFEGKLSEREQPGRQIESLRALYDLWVDAAEEGYSEIALSPDFREAYGAMVNAQMRLRAQVQQNVERMAGDFGMPTRSEVDSIGERLQALRREVRARGTDADGALAREVAALRREVATLKAAAAKESRPDDVAPLPRNTPAAPAKRRVAAAAPVSAASSRKARRKSKGKPERAVAATASGTFASRIAKFAGASLGDPATHRLKKKKSKSEKSGKKR